MKFSNCISSARFLGYVHKTFTDKNGKVIPYLMLDFYDDGRVLSLPADLSIFDSDDFLESLRFSDVSITCDFSRRLKNGGFVWQARVVDMVSL